MHNQRRLAVLCLVLAATVPLTAIPLQDLITQALAESTNMKDLEYSKQKALLTVGLNQVEDELGIAVGSGEVTATYNSGNYVFSTSGTNVAFTLPNDGKTTINVSTGAMGIDAPYSYSSISPSVSASHTLTYGYTADNQKSLLNRQTEVLALSTYDSSKLNFTTSLYSQIDSLLENEKSIKQTEKDLADLQTSLQQNLSLKLIRSDSLAYQAQEQAIKVKEATLANLQSTRELLLRQFSLLAGFAWEGVEAIPEPNLSFTSNPMGNSSVLLKSLALDLAKEELALKKAEFTNKSLVLNGGVSSSHSSSPTDGLSASAAATLQSKNLSAKAGLSGTYNYSTKTFSPSLTVSGSWNNNKTLASDALTLQKLENEVLIAELAYQTALNEYLQNAATLESNIAAWKMTHALHRQSMDYNLALLKQQQTLFEKGLATKADVDDAAFNVEIDAYTLSSILLDGLKLENQIRALQI
ncbi:hypothetical protein [uncultured Sphaerochaeta sp.]|jgi:hypothetical protein|uniref:hypothetical protein n=1 Tax=uncultured Sphaerochaeta sp. TaxID=886478 RepID=UPI00261BA9FA|nr:hypothetical protein [uncultured Sphaerochaeta sp.]